MSHRPSKITQADVRRAVLGATSAGLAVARVEIDPDGKIVLISASEVRPPISERDDLDRELEEFEARHGKG
jgi:hypothetical protein